MKVLALTALFGAVSVSVSVSAGVVPSWGNCGSNAAGAIDDCAQDHQYCMPWSPEFYQCIDFPAKCSLQLTNTDIFGDDLSVVKDIKHPTDCCDKCSQTSGCVAYTFVNGGFPDMPGPTCYLKKGQGQQRLKLGAMSGVLDAPKISTPSVNPVPPPTATVKPPPPPRTTGCSAAWGSCGNSNGFTCCPDGFYCQPWNSTYYQCVNFAPKCHLQDTDVDYYGNDIKTINGLSPGGCCDACGNTKGCVAYTFVNDNPGTPACYLKSAVGTDHRNKKGAVSGILGS